MAPLDQQRKGHIKAGLFVVVAIAIFVAVLITLAGGTSLLRRTTSYTVRFPVDIGAAGLEEGSDVRVGGRSVGAVGVIDLVFEDEARPPVGVDVQINVERSIPVFSDAIAFLERPLFGSSAVINFPSLGGESGATALTNGDQIPGQIAPPDLLRSAGYGPEQSKQLRGIMQRFDDLSVRAVSMMDTFENEILVDVKGATENVESITADVKDRSPQWFDRADIFTEDLVTLSEDAKATLADAREFIDNINSVVVDNRESFDSTIASIESASARADELVAKLNEESVTILNDMLAEGRQRLEEAGEVVERVASLVAEEEPEIRKTLANLRLASDQMKLTMGEVRRSPWRLLYRPKTRELEYELLYDSARTYASAVSDLRAASESLESAMGSDGSRLATNGQSMELFVSEIADAFERYRQAEERFLSALLAQQGNP
jgi:ABC-type transporter Mla subunit MlaD